jgi:hypothetical protein
MATNLDEKPVIDEDAYYHDASLGAMWTASRTGVALLATFYGGIAFAFFYLRSLNSQGQWDPGHLTASTIIGTTIMLLIVVAAVANYFGMRRLRNGYVVDWQVAGTVAIAFLLIAGGMQIWELTRLPFNPAQSGYAGVFIAFAPVNTVAILLSGYWAETLLAKSIRARRQLAADGGLGVSSQPEAETFRASLDGLSFHLNFFALLSIVFFIIFYVV